MSRQQLLVLPLHCALLEQLELAPQLLADRQLTRFENSLTEAGPLHFGRINGLPDIAHIHEAIPRTSPLQNSFYLF